MNHCILFGANGHLSKTKVLPALKSNNISVTSVTRNSKVDLSNIHSSKDTFIFMAIPTTHFIECYKTYEDDLDSFNGPIILEKPIGKDYSDFSKIKDFCTTKNINAIYNDHYLGKDYIRNIKTYDFPNVQDVHKISLILHEESCINDRINYFDNSGIINDMYQSHSLLILAYTLSMLYNNNYYEVLYEFSKLKNKLCLFKKAKQYEGKVSTEATIETIYENIFIEVKIGKYKKSEKCLKIHSCKGLYFYNLDNMSSNPYHYIFKNIKNNDTKNFLSISDVENMWKHININKY